MKRIYMNSIKLMLNISVIVGLCFVSGAQADSSTSLSVFNEKCSFLKPGKSGINWNKFNKARIAFVKTQKKELADSNKWVSQPASTLLKKLKRQSFVPFVQKIEAEDDTHVFFHGDLHGDVHSLLAFLTSLQERNLLNDSLKILDPKIKIIFLGDYVDRGKYGVETLYILWRLKAANPDNVHMVRGNHEDVAICSRYGFGAELKQKFGNRDFSKIYKTYNYLPVALYLGAQGKDGKDFIQCCHGGLESIDQKELLESDKKSAYLLVEQFNRKTKMHKLSNSRAEELAGCLPNCKNFEPKQPTDCGFMWNDFLVDPHGFSYYQQGRGIVYGRKLTHALLKEDSSDKVKVRGVFRAHQHSNTINPHTNAGQLMRLILNKDNALPQEDTGVGKLWLPVDEKGKNKLPEKGKLWDGIVCTFNAPPIPYYTKDRDSKNKEPLFDFDTHGILHMNKGGFDNWTLDVIRTEKMLLNPSLNTK